VRAGRGCSPPSGLEGQPEFSDVTEGQGVGAARCSAVGTSTVGQVPAGAIVHRGLRLGLGRTPGP
jgi:hypothetical protein